MGEPDIEKMKSEKDIEGLIEALKNKDAFVRKRAAEALFKAGDLRAVEALAEALRDDAGIQRAAEKTLAEIAIAKAAEPPAEALRDDEGIQRAAEKTLDEISEESPQEEDGVTTTEEIYGRLRDIVSQYSDKIKHDKIFFAPDIPEKKLANAIKKFANIQEGERPLVLVDDTVFGSAKSGLLVTDQRIYGHEIGEKPRSWAIQDIQDVSFEKKRTGKILYINYYKFLTVTQIGENEVAELINLIKYMASNLRPTQYADKTKEGTEAGIVDKSSSKKQPSEDTRSELLNIIEVYCEAMHFLATCGDFDASKFERLDAILSRAGVSFGSSKRQEMLSQAALILPTRTTGGIAELHVQLQSTLGQALETFSKALAEVSPTPETATEVQRIMDKYRT